MYKIAILGCENSHANAFLDFIAQGLYSDIEVVGVYSEEVEAMESLQKKYGVPIMNSYGECVGKVDGIMITARHGANHYKYAKPYLSSGIPMFVDKPITIDSSEAEIFMEEAKKYGVRLCGGSTCAHVKETIELSGIVKNIEKKDFQGGNLICPLHILEQYGGFYFYAQHLIQIMITIFGEDVQEVFAHKYGENIALIVKYADFDITASYGKMNYYYVTVFGDNQIESRTLTVDTECFKHEMDEMKDLLNGKEQKFSYESFILPVYIMNAIERSLVTQKWEKIK